jgi:hypothetical protein
MEKEICNSKKPSYKSWEGMIYRCNNPKSISYKNYGERGIKVCKRWESSYSNFIEDMGEKPSSKHTIERIDMNGNYEPSNCKWATYKEQMSNKRNNRFVVFMGERLTVTQLAERVGIPDGVLHSRIFKLGWDIEKAIIPKRPKRCDSKGKYLGVSFIPHKPRSGKLYRVRITINGIRKCVGAFNDELQAARCYDYHALIAFGEKANLNFPITKLN